MPSLCTVWAVNKKAMNKSALLAASQDESMQLRTCILTGEAAYLERLSADGAEIFDRGLIHTGLLERKIGIMHLYGIFREAAVTVAAACV